MELTTLYNTAKHGRQRFVAVVAVFEVMTRNHRFKPASHPSDCRVEFFRFCDDELFVFAVYVASVRKNIEVRILA